MAFTLCRLVARATQEACQLEPLALASPLGALALSLLSPLGPHQLDLVLLARLRSAKRSPCQRLELPLHLLLAPLALALELQLLDKAPPQLLAKAVLQHSGKHQLLAHSLLQLLEAASLLHRARQPLEEVQRPTRLVSPHLPLAPQVALALAPLSRAPQGLVPHKARRPSAAQALEALVKAVLHLQLLLQELLPLLPLGSSPSSRARLPSPSAQGVALGPHSSPQGLAQPLPPALAPPLHPALATCLATTSRTSRSPAVLAALVSQILLEVLEHPARQGLVRASPTACLGLLHSRAQLLAAPLGSLHLLLARQVLGSPHSSSSRSCNSLSNSSSLFLQVTLL